MVPLSYHFQYYSFQIAQTPDGNWSSHAAGEDGTEVRFMMNGKHIYVAQPWYNYIIDNNLP